MNNLVNLDVENFDFKNFSLFCYFCPLFQNIVYLCLIKLTNNIKKQIVK